MKKILLWIFIVTSILGACTYFFGWDEDVVYAYRDWKHDRWLTEWLKTAQPTNEENAYHIPDEISVDYLGETRDLEIFLPKGYHDNDSTRYPVLYFYDGDNLFDQIVALGDEWEVDEHINMIDSMGGLTAIVVGIPSSDRHRSSEYKPFPSDQVKEDTVVYGAKHAEWYATDLKDWVDANYRTMPGRENTGIGGCSLGGILAYHSVMTYPDVYGRGIIFSPSFWVDMDKVKSLHKNYPDLSSLRLFLNAGEIETPTVDNAVIIRDILLADGLPKENMYFDVEPGEGHWHAAWRKGFKKAYPWILE